MRLSTTFKALVINTKEEKSKDGSTTYFKISLDQEGEAGTLNCTEDVFRGVTQFKPFEFTGTYSDGKYVGFRVVSFKPYVK